MNLFDSQKPRYIKDLTVGTPVGWYYKLVDVSRKVKKDGGPYLALEFLDKTGRISAKVWDNADAVSKILKEGKVFRVTGQVNEWNGHKEIKVDSIREASPQDKDFSEADFIEQAAFDTEKLFDQVVELLDTHIQDSFLRQLVELFSRQYRETFQKHYGAQKLHHAYMGGLLQHTASMLRFAVVAADHYALDKDLLLIGVLFHDVGKIQEFTISPTLELTMEGGLIGHIMISQRIFLELKNKIDHFPEELSLKIQHLIVSHHGEKEFGSPEVPKTLEAYTLHVIDLLDSRLSIMTDAIKQAEGKNLFTDYIHSLSRRLFIDGKG